MDARNPNVSNKINMSFKVGDRIVTLNIIGNAPVGSKGVIMVDSGLNYIPRYEVSLNGHISDYKYPYYHGANADEIKLDLIGTIKAKKHG